MRNITILAFLLLVAPNSLWAARGTAAHPTVTFTVASSTSNGKNAADYRCDGTADQVEINQAITDCPTAGCRIILQEGTFNTTAAIVPKSGIELVGMGPGKTILKPGNISEAVIDDHTTSSSGSPFTDIVFRDFEIDGSNMTKDTSTSRKGIFLLYVSRLRIQNLYVHDTGATGLGVDFLTDAHIVDNVIDNCGYSSATTGNSGIGIGSGAYSEEPIIIANNHISRSGVAGILLEAQAPAVDAKNWVVSNNVVGDNNQWGILVRGVSQATFTGNVVEGNTKDGVRIETYASIVPHDLVFSGNIISGNSEHGIDINSSAATNIVVHSNNICGNTSGTISNGLSVTSELDQLGNLCNTQNDLHDTTKIWGSSGGTLTFEGAVHNNETFGFDSFEDDFKLTNDINIYDVEPHITFYDETVGDDDFHFYADQDRFHLTRYNSTELFRFDGSNRFYLPNLTSCNTIDTDANGLLSCGTDATGAGGGDAITVNSSAATDPDFLNGDIDWTLTGGNSITATVACTGCIDVTDMATDSVAADEIAAAAVGTSEAAGLDIGDDTNLAAGRSLTLSGDSVESDVELYTESICYRVQFPSAADDDKSVWINDTANTFTVSKLWCESDQTATLMLQVDDGSAADMDSVDLVCISTPDTDTSLDGDATIAAGDRVDLDVASVASSPTWVSVCFTGAWDD